MNGLRFIAITIFALAVGLVAYQVGLSQGLATTLPAGAAPVAYYGYPHWGYGLASSASCCHCSSFSSSSARCAPLLGAAVVATDTVDGAVVANGSRSCTGSCTARSRAATDLPRPAPSIPGMKTVLVVDDEPKIVQLARDYLEHAGFAVVSASDGEAALATARSSHPDLVVLDLGLPELDGLDVARALRRDSTVPIVMLTGRGDEADKIAGLEIGADDYVTKPFSPKELVARVRAVLRRTERPADAADVVRAGEVTLDVPRMRVRVGERAVELTPTEFQLLVALARAPGRIFTRAQLLDAVHGVAFESYERAIDAHVKNIRRKLEPVPNEPRYLLTVYGVGYRFADDEA